MAELDVSVLTSSDRGSGEMEEQMGTTSNSAIAHEHLEYMTAFEGKMLSSSCSTSVGLRRAYRVWLEQVQGQCESEEEFVTAFSKPTWTQVAPVSSSSSEGSSSKSDASSSCMSLDEKHDIQCKNQQFFKKLIEKQSPCKQRPRVYWKFFQSEVNDIRDKMGFFNDFGGRLEVGKKIAQGGQAEIYEALFDGIKLNDRGVFYVLKVFQLEHSEWFRRAWAKESENIHLKDKDLEFNLMCCVAWNCTLLKDGRFAILMVRYWGDLRRAINVQILKDKTHLKPPFLPSISTHIMYQIARAMRSLHSKGILHRDLKADNVFLYQDIAKCMGKDGYQLTVNVADFESAEGVMGTRFWRAPEVLGILRSSGKDKYSNLTVWTTKVDVYAYAMTCYEVLSGCIPFQTRVAIDYNIGEERPLLPDYVDREIQELLRKCWDSDPSKRPTFQTICNELERFSGEKIKCCETLAEDERDVDAYGWLRFIPKTLFSYVH